MSSLRAHRLSLAVVHLGYDVLRATLRPVAIGARMLLVKDNSVLLVYHSYMDNWHFPGGGMKRGETALEAACREAYEEAGAIVTGEPRLLGLFTGSTRGRSDNTAVFVCEDFTLQTPTDRWEIVGRAFFGLDHLPDNITRGYRRVIDQYRQGGPPRVGNW